MVQQAAINETFDGCLQDLFANGGRNIYSVNWDAFHKFIELLENALRLLDACDRANNAQEREELIRQLKRELWMMEQQEKYEENPQYIHLTINS